MRQRTSLGNKVQNKTSRLIKYTIAGSSITAIIVAVFLIKGTLVTSKNSMAIDINKFQFKKEITILSEKVMGNKPLLNYPLFLRLHDKDFRFVNSGGKIQNENGSDVVFELSESKYLKYWIEKYDKENGVFFAWVKIPELSNTEDTKITMYYGNPLYEYTSEANEIWDDKFIGVWPLNEESNNLKAQLGEKNKVIRACNGVVNYAYQTEEEESFLNLGNIQGLNAPWATTFSTWVKFDELGEFNGLLSYMNETGNNTIDLSTGGGGFGTTRDILFQVGFRKNIFGYTITKPLKVNKWHHIAAVFDLSQTGNNKLKVFVDGQLQALVFGNTDAPNKGNKVKGLELGRYRREDHYTSRGIFDQVYVSNIPLSETWIKTEYNNISSPETFYEIYPSDLKVLIPDVNTDKQTSNLNN